MKPSELKEEINRILTEGDVSELEMAIGRYEELYPHDIDLLSVKENYHLLKGDLESAYLSAKEAVRRLPLNGEVQYNYAVLCEEKGLLFDAYEAYVRSFMLYHYTGDEQGMLLKPQEEANRILGLIETMEVHTEEEKKELLFFLESHDQLCESFYGLLMKDFRNKEFPQIVGKYYYENRRKRRYAGVFKDQYLSVYGKNCMDVMHLKAEFLEAEYADTCEVSGQAKEFFLPIASEKPETIHFFKCGDTSETVAQRDSKHFEWYRVPAETKVSSSGPAYYGRPVPLRQIPGKKKLVLSIFVDGLSFAFLQQRGFREIMPYTYDFFNKGAVFTEAYSTAEWTFPSISSYVSGLDTIHHMLCHKDLDYHLPFDQELLAEYFQRDGYFTAMINGNWRIIPPYGYTRGIDRFIYQHQGVGFKVQEIIAETLNHLNAFRETNQYLWISIGDAHDVADMEKLPEAVRAMIPFQYLQRGIKGKTSVKQTYDEGKIAAYKAMLYHIDRWLHVLYDYVGENYRDDEIIVSLFSDHGQGYLIQRSDAHFLAPERAGIAMMFRGDIADGVGECDELVSNLDYCSIMGRLAGIHMDEGKTDGYTPRCFGGIGREYAITESIHPGDSYQAAVHFNDNDNVVYFVNPDPVKDDGRIALGEYRCYIENSTGDIVQDAELQKRGLQIILDHIAPVICYSW
ncbi:MAG: sulfatase-like hydrolase/transferase [Lachnospiraceae bacterium]|nr:sulfatase-like hydrolase/transferase [Lachnospiraceae bacterium]